MILKKITTTLNKKKITHFIGDDYTENGIKAVLDQATGDYVLLYSPTLDYSRRGQTYTYNGTFFIIKKIDPGTLAYKLEESRNFQETLAKEATDILDSLCKDYTYRGQYLYNAPYGLRVDYTIIEEL